MLIKATCDWCEKSFYGLKSQVGRCGKTYCSRKCAGFGRRKNRTKAEKRRLKAIYDEQYRKDNAEKLRKNKAQYFQKTYDPDRARKWRQANKHRWKNYFRQYREKEEWKQHKKSYDFELRASEYGPFAEAWKIWLELVREIRRREPSGYERRKAKGYYSGSRPCAQERRREEGISH